MGRHLDSKLKKRYEEITPKSTQIDLPNSDENIQPYRFRDSFLYTRGRELGTSMAKIGLMTLISINLMSMTDVGSKLSKGNSPEQIRATYSYEIKNGSPFSKIMTYFSTPGMKISLGINDFINSSRKDNQ